MEQVECKGQRSQVTDYAREREQESFGTIRELIKCEDAYGEANRRRVIRQ